ncbi:50S ribosomal protein L3 [Candidatus Fermentibacterales bacterium]|nr:50S ribosomal protein L3 [Candidatus Fermentibacterales bacterium]
MSGLVARKVGMTRIFREDGAVTPVTVLEAKPCPVVKVRGASARAKGCDSVQLAYGPQKTSRLSKPLRGYLEKNGVEAGYARLIELPFPASEVKPGTEITVSLFREGEKVDITGTSKGKGFQGVVKRCGFSGGDDTHGCKSKRVPGSIGQCATPSRVWKGKGLPGRTGGERRTVRNLEVVRVDPERNLIVVKGAVPGARNGYLIVRKSGRSGGSC